MDKLTPDPELDALVRHLNSMNAGARDVPQTDEDDAEDIATIDDAGLGPAGVRAEIDGHSRNRPAAVFDLPRASFEGRERLDETLRLARERGASDLLLVAGAPPTVRVDGALQRLSSVPIAEEETARLCAALVPDERRDAATRHGSVDFGFSRSGLGRFRANVHRAQGHWAAAVRVFPRERPTFESLALPSEVSRLADLQHGLVLVTGPTGSGKSSTLAALTNAIMERRTAHVITIEDPIEFEHSHQTCIVEQIEIGRDAPSFAFALRGALRQDPDVILVGEMRDPESIAIAVTAAETGHLVLSTLHTGNGVQTISRIIDAYPSGQAEVVRSQLAASLEAVVSQQLVPRADGRGRVPVVETLRASDAVRNLIRKNQVEQIAAQVSLGKGAGMLSFDASLAQLVKRGLIAREEARRRAHHPNELDLLLK